MITPNQFSFPDLKSTDIEVRNASVMVTSSSQIVQAPTLFVYGGTKGLSLEVQKGSRLKIKNLLGRAEDNGRKFILALPTDYEASHDIRSHDGMVKLQKVQGRQLAVATTTGRIVVAYSNADLIDVSSEQGDIDLLKLQDCGIVNANTDSGNIYPSGSAEAWRFMTWQGYVVPNELTGEVSQISMNDGASIH